MATTKANLLAHLTDKVVDASPGDSALIGHITTGVGAMATTVKKKLDEHVSVNDFGAVGDGFIDDTAAFVNATATGENSFIPKGSYTLNPATVPGNSAFEWASGKYSSKSGTDFALNVAKLSPAPQLIFTAESRHMQSLSFGNKVARDIYGQSYPGVNNFDVSSNVLQVVSGSNIENAAAVAGYFKSENISPTNCVALSGMGLVEVPGGAGWGINTLLMDAPTRAVGPGTGTPRTIIGAELDFNIMNSNTTLIGVSIGGNSLAAPGGAIGFVVNSLGGTAKWAKGFITIDGTVDSTTGAAVSIGADAASGVNIPSQRMSFGFRDAGGSAHALVQQFTSGFFLLQATTTWNGIKIGNGSLWLDGGFGVLVNGVGVVGGRRTGWTAPTGATNRGTWDTSTVTLPNLAAAVSSLLADLRTHGLIGT